MKLLKIHSPSISDYYIVLESDEESYQIEAIDRFIGGRAQYRPLLSNVEQDDKILRNTDLWDGYLFNSYSNSGVKELFSAVIYTPARVWSPTENKFL